MKKGGLRNFAKFPGKHLCQSLLFNKVAGLKPATLLKLRLWHRSFSCEFCEISKTTIVYRTPRVAASETRHFTQSYIDHDLISYSFAICKQTFWLKL